MSDAKHTPGPWHVGAFRTGDPPTVYATNADLEIVARVPYDGLLTERVQDNIANARLIAAAPELLEALEVMIDVFAPIASMGEPGPDTHARTKALGLAEAAIAKATGKDAA